MTTLNPTLTLPLEMGPDGVYRVGQTRVTLDTLVAAFAQGATAEEMAQQYPSVALADIYAVIGYYLLRQEEVEGYLEQRQQQADETRRANEARHNPVGIRQRLLARRSAGR